MRTPDRRAPEIQGADHAKVGADTVFVPYSFGGWWQGVDLLPHYPEGSAPFVRGDAINTGTTYGYDRVTMMQETKDHALPDRARIGKKARNPTWRE